MFLIPYRLACVILVFGISRCSFGVQQHTEAALLQHIQDITTRAAWHHKFVLPEEALAKSLTIVGDTSRLTAMATKLVLGKLMLCCDWRIQSF